ncbi:hypothetical protein, partial [Salmonella enterica]|uniref:hypothetical protein n=1 Tax=Salmonella enterica TaxID=28901 RepID=UPI00329A49B1
GGLLFRCTGCLTSYCEDCLPEEEIESIGRFRAVESSTEYLSKQSYYIKCPSCCYVDNLANPAAKGNKGITANRGPASPVK